MEKEKHTMMNFTEINSIHWEATNSLFPVAIQKTPIGYIMKLVFDEYCFDTWDQARKFAETKVGFKVGLGEEL